MKCYYSILITLCLFQMSNEFRTRIKRIIKGVTISMFFFTFFIFIPY